MPILRTPKSENCSLSSALIPGLSPKVYPLDYSCGRNLEFKTKRNIIVMVIIDKIY